MRAIKFKAKRVSDGEWVEGDYCSLPSPNIMFLNSRGEIDVEPIDPNTLCQFTGLHDRNGKEIYEGDIVNVSTKFVDIIGEISWNNGDLCYMILFVDGESEPLYGWHSKEVEILGNIYNNNNK